MKKSVDKEYEKKKKAMAGHRRVMFHEKKYVYILADICAQL